MCQEWIDKLTQFSTVYALASPRTLCSAAAGHISLYLPISPLCLPLPACISPYLPISPHISPYLPRAPLCRGRLRLISGATAEGLHLLRKSQQLAAKMGMPYDEALALRLLSMHSKSSARESQQAEQEAQEIFKRLGVDPSFV